MRRAMCREMRRISGDSGRPTVSASATRSSSQALLRCSTSQRAGAASSAAGRGST
jgi:hypothetical protein